MDTHRFDFCLDHASSSTDKLEVGPGKTYVKLLLNTSLPFPLEMANLPPLAINVDRFAGSALV